MRHAAMLPTQRSPVILRPTPMNSQPPRRVPRRWALAAMAMVILFVSGFTVVRANVLGMGERLDRWAARVEAFIDPPPDRSTIPTVVVTPQPSPSPTPPATPTPVERAVGHTVSDAARPGTRRRQPRPGRNRGLRLTAHRKGLRGCRYPDGADHPRPGQHLGGVPDRAARPHRRMGVVGGQPQWRLGSRRRLVGPRRVRRARIRDPCLRRPTSTRCAVPRRRCRRLASRSSSSRGGAPTPGS